jgi:hypothetical protein
MVVKGLQDVRKRTTVGVSLSKKIRPGKQHGRRMIMDI